MSSIKLVDYNPDWPRQFEREAARLGPGMTLYHVGSTSIPGMRSKPIIDMVGVVKDLANIPPCPGYERRGTLGVVRRCYMNHPEFHLHIYEEGNPHIARHLLFRDYLAAHPEQAARYLAKKEELARHHSDNRFAYTTGKGPIICELDIAALAAWHGPLPHWQERRRARLDEAREVLCDAMSLEMTFLTYYNPLWRVQPLPNYSANLIVAELEDSTFNNVYSDSLLNLDQIEAVTDQVRAGNRPFRWVVYPHLAPLMGPLLLQAGWRPMQTAIGMFHTLDRPFQRSDRVVCVADLKDFAQVVVDSGEHPECYDLIFRYVPSRLCTPGGPFEWYVLYDQGRPVATGMLLFFGGAAHVAWIATRPDARRQGHGLAMVETLCARAQERDYHLAVLWASSMGQSLYRRSGFIPFTEVTEYAVGHSCS